MPGYIYKKCNNKINLYRKKGYRSINSYVAGKDSLLA